MSYGGAGRGSVPMSSAQLEQQFQARIAQAKEAARLASIAAAARAQNASNGPPFSSMPAVPGVPFRPPPIPQVSTRFSATPEPLAMGDIPPDVKNRIDRLVDFVARNGDAFEAAAKQRERDNPDFAFLTPGGPYSDYYQWKKQQICDAPPPVAGPPMGFVRTPPPRPPFSSPNGPTDPLGDMSVGAMANVCKSARASGVQAYVPIPQEVIMNVGSLPQVEPARLEIRLSEFYRDEDREQRDLVVAVFHVVVICIIVKGISRFNAETREAQAAKTQAVFRGGMNRVGHSSSNRRVLGWFSSSTYLLAQTK